MDEPTPIPSNSSEGTSDPSVPLPEATEIVQATNNQPIYGQLLGQCNTLHQHFYSSTSESVISSPSTTRQHTGDNPPPAIIPNDEIDLPTSSFFIGRKGEQDWLTTRLQQRESNTISAIYGLGGIGKTSLVAWTVQRLRKWKPACFPDGIAVVYCENQTSVEEVLRGIVKRFAPALVQPQTADWEQLRTLIWQLLKGKDALIILDNIEPKLNLDIEQVMNPLQASGVHVILTARQRLRVDIVFLQDTRTLDLLSLEEALTVFANRAGYPSAKSLPEKAQEAGKQIIKILDRHSLAITLAGAHVGLLLRDQVDLIKFIRELADPQYVLDLSDLNVPPPLRRIFSHSIEQLPSAAKYLFAGLVAFAQRDFGYDACLELAAALSSQTEPPWKESPKQVVDLLIGCLFVSRSQNSLMAENTDRIRLYLHPLLHTLAYKLFQKWSSEAQDQAHRAIARYYATYAKKLDREFATAARQQTQVDEVAFLADEENMNDKLDWALKQPKEDDLVAELCLGLRRFWRDHWRVRASNTYLQQGLSAALRLANTAQDSATLQRAVELARHAGYCSLYAWDDQWPNKAEQNFIKMLQVAQSAKDQISESTAMFFLGQISLLRGQPEEAEEYFQHSQILRRQWQQPDPQEWPLDAITFNQIARKRHYVDIARRHYQKVVEIAVENKDQLGEAVNQFSLAQLAFCSQHYEDAKIYYRKPLEIAHKASFRTAEGVIHTLLGGIAIEQEHLEQAESELKIGLNMLHETRSWREQGWVHYYLGWLAQKRGDWENADSEYKKSRSLAEQVQDDLCLGATFFGSAEIAEIQENSPQAEALYRQSLALHTKIQSGLDLARVQLGLGRFLLEKIGNRTEGEMLVRLAIQGYMEMELPELDCARKEAERLQVSIE